MTAIMQPKLTLTNVRDTTTTLIPGSMSPVLTVSTSNVLGVSIKRDQKGTEEITCEVAMGDNGGIAIDTASTPGAAIPTICELSLCTEVDGTTRYIDARSMLETPVYTIDLSGRGGSRISLAQKGLFRGYSLTLIDHLTTHGVPLQALIDAPPGPFSTAGTLGQYVHSAGFAGIGIPQVLQFLKGYGQTIPGATYWVHQAMLKFNFYTDPAIGDFLVDSDEDSSPIDMAMLSAINVAAGYGSGGQTLGLHGHWVNDSSDEGAGNAGATAFGSDGPCINIGGLFSSGLTFTIDPTLVGNGAYGDPIHDAYAPILSPVSKERHLEDIAAKYLLVGGTSNHGLPQGATITGMVVVNLQTGTYPTTDALADLLVVGCKTPTGDGGVFYYHTNTRLFFACSPVMAVDYLTYDASGNAMYAATAHGCYRKQNFFTSSIVPPTIAGWQAIGGNTGTTPPRSG